MKSLTKGLTGRINLNKQESPTPGSFARKNSISLTKKPSGLDALRSRRNSVVSMQSRGGDATPRNRGGDATPRNAGKQLDLA